jgi:hypothetical protein
MGLTQSRQAAKNQYPQITQITPIRISPLLGEDPSAASRQVGTSVGMRGVGDKERSKSKIKDKIYRYKIKYGRAKGMGLGRERLDRGYGVKWLKFGIDGNGCGGYNGGSR